MAKNTDKTDKTEEKIVAVEGALGKGEKFFEKYKNLLFYVLIGILIIVAGYLGYKKFILGPKEKEAQTNMFPAEQYFEKDSLDLALNGDGNNPGMLEIADQYGSTKGGNLANYYVGIIYLKKGEFQLAIDYLEDFDSEDMIVGPMAIGAIGDAYIELGDNDKALEYYLKASEKKNNYFTTPMFLMKAGWTYELKGEYGKAVEMYEKIKKEHNKSFEARDIDKYIERAKGMIG